MVVMREEMGEALARVVEVLRMDALPELARDRLPQSLTLAERFRMVRAGNDVLDALADQQLLEFASAAPREVLASLIGQDLVRLAEARDAIEQGLGDQLARLPEPEREAHHIAAVVIQEHRQVGALAVACEYEARDVALPEFAGS